MAARRPLVIFSFLALYIVLQFGWWVYLIHQQGTVILALENGDPVPEHRTYSISMVISEGAVFLAIVLLGLWVAYRSYRKEFKLIRAKDNFLMAVTHELRTPIAGMRLNMQTLQRTDLSEEKRDHLLQNAINDTERLQNLSDRILVAAESDGAKSRMRPETIDAAASIRAICDSAQNGYGSGHDIKVAVEEPSMLHFDPLAFESIVDNLVQNAVKYSPNGSTVSVEQRSTSKGVQILVKDQGPGIPKSERKLIFEKFYRSGDEKTRQTKGTGLGLHIVKQLTDRANGKVSVSSADPGGSVFTVELPNTMTQ